MSKGIVVITGATGFLGSHVVDQFLKAGYPVRAVCRSGKAEQLKTKSSDPNFSVWVVDDIVAGDVSEVMKGANALVHVASPTPFYQNHIQVAVEGSLNFIRGAYAAGVRKIVFISSFYSAFTTHDELRDATKTLDDKSWGTVPDHARGPDANPFVAYSASKLLAEQAVWDWADQHPDADVVAILPAYFYGPVVPFHIIKEPTTLSTDFFIYGLIGGEKAQYPMDLVPLQTVDVRDVAKSCVLSLNAKPAQPGQHRRILMCSGHLNWKGAARAIGLAHPELKDRLIDRGEVADEPADNVTKIDTTAAKEILGFKEFIPWAKSVADAAASLVASESSWGA